MDKLLLLILILPFCFNSTYGKEEQEEMSVTLLFLKKKFVTRWQSKTLLEMCPFDQKKSVKWKDLMIFKYNKYIKNKNDLQLKSKYSLKRFKLNKNHKLLTSKSIPNKLKKNDEYLFTIMYPYRDFTVVVFSRWLIQGNGGMVITYAHRIYGDNSSNEMEAWLKINKKKAEIGIMSLNNIFTKEKIKVLFDYRHKQIKNFPISFELKQEGKVIKSNKKHYELNPKPFSIEFNYMGEYFLTLVKDKPLKELENQRYIINSKGAYAAWEPKKGELRAINKIEKGFTCDYEEGGLSKKTKGTLNNKAKKLIFQKNIIYAFAHYSIRYDSPGNIFHTAYMIDGQKIEKCQGVYYLYLFKNLETFENTIELQKFVKIKLTIK